jgi:hypothetical protein
VSVRSEPVILLGRKIVDELGLDQTVDTLGRWMAHYIAELIHDVETAGVEERPAKLVKCADAILELWGHRHELPSGRRPFEELEPILRAVQSLDPSDETPRYFRQPRTAPHLDHESAETKQWLDLADGLDYSARILIGDCLVRAARSAVDKTKEWVSLAAAAGRDDGADLMVIRFIAEEDEQSKAAKLDEAVRKKIENRIARLDAFRKMARALASDLRRQIKGKDL